MGPSQSGLLAGTQLVWWRTAQPAERHAPYFTPAAAGSAMFRTLPRFMKMM
ncbi:MAG: chitosanase [Oscillatoria princeps RMCB-10]|nr:chitosanase [Oscillatoria princeps RMCB-10]